MFAYTHFLKIITGPVGDAITYNKAEVLAETPKCG